MLPSLDNRGARSWENKILPFTIIDLQICQSVGSVTSTYIPTYSRRVRTNGCLGPVWALGEYILTMLSGVMLR